MTVRDLVQRLLTMDPETTLYIGVDDDLMGRHYYDPLSGITEVDAVYTVNSRGQKIYASQWSNINEEGRERILLIE